jgi:hypothetical protein
MFRQPAVYFLLFIILIAFASIQTVHPPGVISDSAPDSVFSAERASVYLRELTKAPHSIGTTAHTLAREYIVSTCKNLGLDTEIQSATAIKMFDRGVVAGNVNNIVATLKGTTGDKAVVIMSHYDSQPNSLGAGDDGASVAAMLETARILKSGKPLKNDILFLFTDGEEDGLLGAQAFVKESPLLNTIGLVINFEGRGNSGVSTMFEVNPQNGWAINEFIKSAAHPVANSLSFEVYKNLPNDTDYTVFKEAGVTGLNNAYIDGFVNYHSMTDGAANMNLKSLQNQGDNMLSLAKHFGNQDLSQTKAPDVSYFNIPFAGLIHYPVSWDIVVIVASAVLFLFIVFLEIRSKQLSFKGLAFGFLVFIAVLVLFIFSSYYFIKAIKAVYPSYQQFYENNAYNAHDYFFALTAFAIGLFALVYQWALRKTTVVSLMTGVQLTIALFIGLMYKEIPTGVYILSFPLLFHLIGCLVLLLWPKANENNLRYNLIHTLFSLPAIILITPTIYLLFIAFGLGGMAPGAILTIGLLLGLIFPLFPAVLKSKRYLIPIVSLMCCFGALLLAHFHSGYSKHQPLQTNIWYVLDADAGKAKWISGFSKPDFWNVRFFPDSKSDGVIGRTGPRLTNDAALVSLSPPEVIVEKDTVENGTRKLKLHLKSTRKAISMIMLINEKNPALKMIINEMDNQSLAQGPLNYLNFVGLDEKGFTLNIETKSNAPFEFTLTDRTMGLPDLENKTTYPANVIPGPGSNSNTTQVKKAFSL